MAWNFTFQGVREDAIAAVANLTTSTGPGDVDQLNRAKVLLTSELQAMKPGTVLAQCDGDWDLNDSRIHIRVRSVPVLNNGVLSVPNPPNALVPPARV